MESEKKLKVSDLFQEIHFLSFQTKENKKCFYVKLDIIQFFKRYIQIDN